MTRHLMVPIWVHQEAILPDFPHNANGGPEYLSKDKNMENSHSASPATTNGAGKRLKQRIPYKIH